MAAAMDVNGAFQAWLATTEPAAEDGVDADHALDYRRLGHALAVLDNESLYLVLCRIETEPAHRGEGHATRLLEHLKALCDDYGATLLGQATAHAGDGLDQQALLGWYARHGFEIDRQSSVEPLVWYPSRPAS